MMGLASELSPQVSANERIESVPWTPVRDTVQSWRTIQMNHQAVPLDPQISLNGLS